VAALTGDDDEGITERRTSKADAWALELLELISLVEQIMLRLLVVDGL
jgi:hypothetical protein